MKRIFSTAICALSLLAGARAEVPDLVYSFDNVDTPHETVDLTGGVRHLKITPDSILTNEPTRFGAGSLLIGKGARAATAGWYLALKSMPELAGATEKISLSFWIFPKDNSAISFIRRSQFSNEERGVFGFQLDRYDRLVFSLGKERVQSQPIGLQVGEWTHLAVTFHQGRVTFYVNGISIGEDALGLEEIPAASTEGAFSAFLHAPVGLCVDDFGFFGNRVLSSAEVTEIYTKGLESFITAAKN